MTEKYTKDKLLDILIDANKKMTDYMGQVANAIHSMNDNNILHRKAIEVNTDATKQMTVAVKSQLSLTKWILIVLVLAIVVLAGAEKVLKFLPNL